MSSPLGLKLETRPGHVWPLPGSYGLLVLILGGGHGGVGTQWLSVQQCQLGLSQACL